MTRMRTHIRITQAAWDTLVKHHRRADAVEHASVALGKTLRFRGNRVVLIDLPGLALLDGDDCLRQAAGAVQVKPGVTRHLMWWFAQSDYDAFVSIHDHWFSGSGTTFSGIDDADDIRQDRYLRGPFSVGLDGSRFGVQRSITHLSIVFDQRSLDARVIDSRSGGLAFSAVDSIAVIGDRLERLVPNTSVNNAMSSDESLRRHDDFITPRAKQLISALHVGIVGCGGLGPLVAENLMRAGVRRFSLFDPDRLEATNLNRWLAGRRADLGKNKAELLAARLRDCEPAVEITAYPVDVLCGRHNMAAGICDLLVLAVDNDAARFWGNRLASACLMPLFDLGVLVRTQPQTDFFTRIVPVIPGRTACLECSALGLLDMLEISKALDGEAPAPSVMGLNTKVAGEAVLAILDFLSGWQPGPPRAATWTWSMAKTVMVEPQYHLPGENCSSCGPDGLARGIGANLPARRDAASLQGMLHAVLG